MPHPTIPAIVSLVVLVALGVALHLFERWGVHARVTAREWRHPRVFIPLLLGLALGVASMAQNAHSPWMVHLGFCLTYLFLFAALLWAINVRSNPGQAALGKAFSVCLFVIAIVVVGLFHYDKIISLQRTKPLAPFTQQSQPQQQAQEQAPPAQAPAPIPLKTYDLSGRRGEIFSALLSSQLEPRDTIKVGCIGWMEDSCIAAGKFLILFSQAGWKIDSNRVFRFDPGIPPEGMTIASKTPKYTDNLPPHLGHWSAMDASQVTFWQTFWWMQIPVGGSGDPDMPEGTIGVYFGPEPTNVNVRTVAQTHEQLAQFLGWILIQVQVLKRTCSTQADICKTKSLQWGQVVSTLLDYCDCGLNKSWSKKWKDASNDTKGDQAIIVARQYKVLQRFISALNEAKHS